MSESKYAMKKHKAELGTESNQNCTLNRVIRKNLFEEVAFEQIWTEIWVN